MRGRWQRKNQLPSAMTWRSAAVSVGERVRIARRIGSTAVGVGHSRTGIGNCSGLTHRQAMIGVFTIDIVDGVRHLIIRVCPYKLKVGPAARARLFSRGDGHLAKRCESSDGKIIRHHHGGCWFGWELWPEANDSIRPARSHRAAIVQRDLVIRNRHLKCTGRTHCQVACVKRSCR